MMKVFYYDAYLDKGIESNNLKEVSLNQALDYFYELTDEEGSFIGFIDDKDNCIQFAWQSQDKWLVDIPNSETGISFQKHADYDECTTIIEDIFRKNKIEKTNDMTPQRIF